MSLSVVTQATGSELEAMLPTTALRMCSNQYHGMEDGLGWLCDYWPWIIVALLYDSKHEIRPPVYDSAIRQKSLFIVYGWTGFSGNDNQVMTNTGCSEPAWHSHRVYEGWGNYATPPAVPGYTTSDSDRAGIKGVYIDILEIAPALVAAVLNSIDDVDLGENQIGATI